jgi:hypothetical protein
LLPDVSHELAAKGCFLPHVQPIVVQMVHTNFHSSGLLRVLADLGVVQTAEPGTAFAEKLSTWLNLNDAITLRAIHNAPAPTKPTRGAGTASWPLGDEFTRVRTSLVTAISKGFAPKVERPQRGRSAPMPEVSLEEAASYEPYRQHYLAHQRSMETNAQALRAKVREALARTSPTLKQLATLDATFDAILRDRESKLLATLPGLLEQRFTHLLKAHQQQLAVSQQTDNTASWMKPGGWLARFCHELQTVLLAELDMRLHPTVGLIEAFNHEKQTNNA